MAIYVRIERYESYLLKDAKNIEIGDVDGKLHNNWINVSNDVIAHSDYYSFCYCYPCTEKVFCFCLHEYLHWIKL